MTIYVIICDKLSLMGSNMRYSAFYHKVKTESASFISAGIIIENEQGEEIRRIYDVSTDFEAIEKFTASLNENDVSSIHFESMLEDYYSEHC